MRACHPRVLAGTSPDGVIRCYETIDQIHYGLVWLRALGLFASTVFTLFAIQAMYRLLYAGGTSRVLKSASPNGKRLQ